MGRHGTPTAAGALDDATLARGLARWLAQRHGVDPVTVDELERPSVGYSSITVLFRARWQADSPVTEHLVVRMAPTPVGLFADYDLGVQHAAQHAAAAAGVPVAIPLVEHDTEWLGAPFMVMPRVDGHIVNETPAFDPWVSELGLQGQAELHEHFVATLGQIHSADHTSAVEAGVAVRDDDAELEHWREYLAWSSDGDPVPALVDALDWCRANAPAPRADSPGVLCWGDVRLGNVVFGDDRRPRAVLDWDMTVVGRREHDIAWYTALASTMANLLGRRVEGFPDRDATVAQYEHATGATLQDLDWYETFALVRSTAIMTRIGYLTIANGGRPNLPIDDNPLLDVLRQRTRGS
jgi:aminoglycoside phosphotransferase (APT) family kinase protein